MIKAAKCSHQGPNPACTMHVSSSLDFSGPTHMSEANRIWPHKHQLTVLMQNGHISAISIHSLPYVVAVKYY